MLERQRENSLNYAQSVQIAFEQRADCDPEAIAAQSRDHRLTYRELDLLGNRIAHRLARLGVQPGDIVAILAQRGLLLVAAALGTLKAGAAYAPIDPDNPPLRILQQMTEARVRAAIVPRHLLDRVNGTEIDYLELDENWLATAAEDVQRPTNHTRPSDLFAVIFTSGSTGVPKGVAIEHRNFLNLMQSASWLSPWEREDALQVCAPQFDVGVYELWATLLAGGRLVCHSAGRPEPHEVCATICNHDVTWAAMATGVFHQLVEHGPEPLSRMRMLLVGGEPLLPIYARRFRSACPNTRLVNIYGPTETTVFVCAQEVDDEVATMTRIPVGRALPSAHLYVLDAQGAPVRDGERGELWVGGPGIARGYLHRPELTRERFVTGLEWTRHGERLYRTGDIVRKNLAGGIEIFGRSDDQIKMHGYRVELGEIEMTLASHPDVRRTVVVVRHDLPGPRRLIAYVTPATEAPAIDSMQRYLQERLPWYMAPNDFVILDHLPLNVNGKVDRHALPKPSQGRIQSGQSILSPLTEKIASIFAAVLDLPMVDPADDFLALGGDSLLGVQVLARLREAYGLELPLAAIFSARTATALAELAESLPKQKLFSLPPLRARVHTSDVPATATQAKALLISELADESLPYQSQAVHRIVGSLDVGALQRALTALIARHEILRTTFHRVHGTWIQKVHDPAPVRFAVTDLSGEPKPEEALETHFTRAHGSRIDPTKLPLAHWSLVRLHAQDHALIAIEHHIVHDGASTARLLEELSHLYTAEIAGCGHALPPLPAQFRDFASWQSDLIVGDWGQRTLAYWRSCLDGAPPLTVLPTDRPRSTRQTYRGNTLRRTLSTDLAREIAQRAGESGTTCYVMMLAAYCILLAQYGNRAEIVIGSALANRRTVASERLLGMLVNTVPLRIELQGISTLGELIDRVSATVLEAQVHQDVPFEKIVEQLAPARSANALPFYQTLFSFHDARVQTIPFGGAFLVPRDALPNGSAKADLNVVVINRRAIQGRALPDQCQRLAEEGLTLVWEYNTDLFELDTAGRMLSEYCALLEQLVACDRSDPLHSLVLPQNREQSLPLQWAGHSAPYERDATVTQVFEACAAKQPEAPAVRFGALTLSYLQLDRRANRLAHRLRAWNVHDGRRVGVCLDRSLDLVVTFLAIAKAGAAYVPLDPVDPPARIAQQLASLGIGLVVTHSKYRERLLSGPIQMICLDDGLDLEREPDSPPVTGVGPRNALYVMFTSGSTGQPRAVEVPHRAVVRLVRNSDYVQLGPDQTLLGLAPCAFDASTFELWGALLNGAQLALAPPGLLSTGELAEIIVGERITTLWLTAGLFQRVVDDRPDSLRSIRQLLTGGDVISPDHVRRALQVLPRDAVLINGYGPTEATTFSCAHRMLPGAIIEVPVPIGRPLANTRVYILDATGAPVPTGVSGNIWIGGDGLALGYLGDSALTADRFRPDPFVPDPEARIYYTGDLGRWRPDGAIDFCGRADRQVKIRGFRVEPVEIEETLRAHPLVADVYVGANIQIGNERGLAAYIVPTPGAILNVQDLRAHTSNRLPAYAVPSAWVELDRLPLTTNGKLDISALPRAEIRVPRGTIGRDNPDRFERQLIAIWSNALDSDKIGLDDDFFELGGHSLLAVQVFEAIESTFGRSLPLSVIFEASTVRRLAAVLREDGWAAPSGSLIALTRTGTRPPLFFVAAGDGNSVGFGALARRLGPDQPFYALQQRGVNGGRRLDLTVEAMARRYIKQIKQICQHGPYLLGGRCLGAYVAYEMARQLETLGEQTKLLVVLDSGGPLWRERSLADGTPFDRIMNSALRSDTAAAARIGDVFSVEGTQRFLSWLGEPIFNFQTITRYLFELYRLRTDLRETFPDVPGSDAPRLIEWAWTHGRTFDGLSELLLPHPGEPRPVAPPWARLTFSAGRKKVSERFKWHAGEIIDLLTCERLFGAVSRRRERVRAASNEAAGSYRAGPYRGRVVLIRSEEYRQQNLLEQWYGLDSGGIIEREVRGTHRSMLREPDVAALAEVLQSLVDQAIIGLDKKRST